MRFAVMLDPLPMNTVHVELTRRCNLRCVYCCVSQPDHEATEDMPIEVIQEVSGFLERQRPSIVAMNGVGETTMLEGWHRHCEPLLSAGLALHLITNLARNLNREDIDTLARFHSIQVSLDTTDAELLRETRRNVDLRTILFNILQIRAAAIRNVVDGTQPEMPIFSFSVVVHDKNIFHLEDVLFLGRALGVQVFDFCNMTKYPDLENVMNVQPIAHLPADDVARALTALERIKMLSAQFQMTVTIAPGLVESLRERLDSGKSQVKEEWGGLRFTQNVPPGFTRDCTDPWRFLMVLANADVWPCCWYPSIGKITGPGSLIELHNNDTIRTLRAQLGSGELTHYCQNCPGRAVVSVEDFQKKHPELFTPTPCDSFRQALSRGDLSVLENIGDGLAQEGMLKEAGAAYQEAITENPRDPRALAGLGVLDLIQGNPSRAAERFALVLETDERDATALCGMGLARKADGCAGEAIGLFMKSLDADPVNVTALNELVKVSHELGRLEGAERYLSTYLQYKPVDPHILFLLAGVLHKAGKLEGALDSLETLRTFYPTYDGAAELEERIITEGPGVWPPA